MRWSAPLLIASLLAVGSAGCRSCQRVEAELRAREDQLREAQQKLECLRAENYALQNQVRIDRGEPIQPNGSPPPAISYPIREVTLGRQTAGVEPDGKGGDTALQVVLEPRDLDGHVIKTAGTAEIEVYELPREGARRLLSKWTINADQLRRSWKASLFGSSYTLTLPWQNVPTTPKLLVIARFITPEGHVFEAGAGKEITVKLLSGGGTPPGPALFEGPVPQPMGGPALPPQVKPDDSQSRRDSHSSLASQWWVVPGTPGSTTVAKNPPASTPPPPIPRMPTRPLADPAPEFLRDEPAPARTQARPVGAWDPGW